MLRSASFLHHRPRLGALWLILACLAGESLLAQQPIRHELIRSDMPPGAAAYFYQMNNRSLVNYVQPVQLIAPEGCVVEIGDLDGFRGASQMSMSVGMLIGPVYRFKLSNLPLPGKQDRALYPSIEVINRLYPPEGQRNEFPIQVMITRQDLDLALQGQLVTRVIYLEDPRGPQPHQHRPGQQPSFDVGGGEDPLRAAEQVGRPVAILRLGSRVPMESDIVEQFNFGTPRPEILPLPEKFQTASQSPSRIRDSRREFLAQPAPATPAARVADRDPEARLTPKVVPASEWGRQ